MKIKLILPVIILIFIFGACSASIIAPVVSKKDNHLVLGSVEYVNKILDISEKRGNRSALSQIMMDVGLYGSDLDHNDPKNDSRFHKLISTLIYKIGYVDKETHYFRNKLNRGPKSLKEMIRINRALPVSKRWRLLTVGNSCYHIQGKNGEYNLKFVSYDGYCEAVYNKKGVLLTDKNDPINMGTYNYAAGIPSIDAHSKYDIAPYMKWGNTPNSPQKGRSAIVKARHIALLNYKKYAASVFIYRKDLFGMQQGRVA